jgi:hypothetical protein
LRDVNDKTIDVDRVRTILRKKVLDAWGSLESDPHGAISYDLIGHMLYGNTAEDVSRPLRGCFVQYYIFSGLVILIMIAVIYEDSLS